MQSKEVAFGLGTWGSSLETAELVTGEQVVGRDASSQVQIAQMLAFTQKLDCGFGIV